MVAGGLMGAACSPIPHPGAWHMLHDVPGVTGVEAMLALPDGRVVVLGGGATAIFDPRLDRWSRAAPMPPVLGGEAATLLRDGSILVSGGTPPSGSPGLALASAYLYQPSSDRWAQTGSMLQARELHTSTLLADGRVLNAGGVTEQGVTAGCEIYDPSTRRWTQAASMALPHGGHSATLLSDGRVLVAGGSSSTQGLGPFQPEFPDYQPEVYDPGLNRWTTASFAIPVANPLIIPLPDGRVLATGGFSGPIPSRVTQELDPRTGRWTMKAAIPQPGQPAVLLGDGRVLVLNGFPNSTYDPSSDRWDPATLAPPSLGASNAIALRDGQVLVVGFASSPAFVTPTGPPSLLSAIFDPTGYPPLPGSSGPLASGRLILSLASIAVALLLLTGIRFVVVRR